MNSEMPYVCTFCGAPGVAKYQSEFIAKADFWKSILCCNRCGDYKSKLRSLTDAVSAECMEMRFGKKTDMIRATLERLTKAIATIVCAYHRIPNTWSFDFVDQLMERPDSSGRIIRAYETFADKRQPAPPKPEPRLSWIEHGVPVELAML